MSKDLIAHDVAPEKGSVLVGNVETFVEGHIRVVAQPCVDGVVLPAA